MSGLNDIHSGLNPSSMRVNRDFLQEYASVFSLILRLIDLTLVGLSGLLAYALINGLGKPPGVYMLITVLGGVLALLVFDGFSIYRPWRGISLLEQLRTISLAWLGIFLSLLAIQTLIEERHIMPINFFMIWFALGWLVLMVSRVALRMMQNYMRQSGLNRRRIALVGSTELASRIVEHFRHNNWVGIDIIGFFDDREAKQRLEVATVPRLGKFQDIEESIQQYNIDQVWLTLPLSEKGTIQRVIDNLRHVMTDLRFIPDIFAFLLVESFRQRVSRYSDCQFNRVAHDRCQSHR